MNKKFLLIIALSLVTGQFLLSQNKETKYFPVRLKTPAPSRIDVIAGMENVKDISLQEKPPVYQNNNSKNLPENSFKFHN